MVATGDLIGATVKDERAASAGASPADSRPDRVLVVEDEAALLDVLVQLFEHEGFFAVGAEDGRAGLRAFEDAQASDPFDLVILDVMMPKMNGFEVCEVIRRTSDVPIMVLTALSAEDDQLKAFGLLADDYVTKPFSLPVVLERARALLRRSHRARAVAPTRESTAVLHNGDIAIDLEARTVERAGKPIDLTRTEFDVLAALYAHPGRVLTREALVEKAQGYTWVGNDNVIKLHVMNIRRKLGDDAIETVRGVGYRAPRR